MRKSIKKALGILVILCMLLIYGCGAEVNEQTIAGTETGMLSEKVNDVETTITEVESIMVEDIESVISTENTNETIAEEIVEESEDMENVEEPVEEVVEFEPTEENISIVAKAYADAMKYMFDNKFEVYDVTGDGIPEIVGAAGTSIITYTPWNQRAEYIVEELILFDIYFDEQKEILYMHSTGDIFGEDGVVYIVTFNICEDIKYYDWTNFESTKDISVLNGAKLIVDGISCCETPDDRTFSKSIARYNNDEETRNNLVQILKEYWQIQ